MRSSARAARLAGPACASVRCRPASRQAARAGAGSAVTSRAGRGRPSAARRLVDQIGAAVAIVEMLVGDNDVGHPCAGAPSRALPRHGRRAAPRSPSLPEASSRWRSSTARSFSTSSTRRPDQAVGRADARARCGRRRRLGGVGASGRGGMKRVPRPSIGAEGDLVAERVDHAAHDGKAEAEPAAIGGWSGPRRARGETPRRSPHIRRGGMPMPVSATSMRSWSPCLRAPTRTPPLRV